MESSHLISMMCYNTYVLSFYCPDCSLVICTAQLMDADDDDDDFIPFETLIKEKKEREKKLKEKEKKVTWYIPHYTCLYIVCFQAIKKKEMKASHHYDSDSDSD